MYTDNEKSRRAAEVRDCGSGIAEFFGFRRAESRKARAEVARGGAEPSGNVPAQNSISGQHTGYGIIKRKHPSARFGWMPSFLNLSSTVSGAAEPCPRLPGKRRRYPARIVPDARLTQARHEGTP